MSWHYSRTLGLAAIGAVLMHGSVFAHNLSVCIDRASPTAQADRVIATAVAKAEHAKLDVRNFDSSDDDDGYGLKDFRGLLAQGCSLVLGFPVESAMPALSKDLAFTPPYAETGFVLAAAKDLKAASLDDLPAGTEVAVTSGTIANFIVADQPRLKPNLLPTERETLKALVSGEDKAALLWRPIIDAPTAAKFDLSPLAASHTTWDLTALYATDDAQDAEKFQVALNDLRSSGELAKILAPYGMVLPQAQVRAQQVQVQQAQAQQVQAQQVQVGVTKIADAAAAPTAAMPALYTAAQAAIGEKKFQDNCSQCHGADLSGISGPALVGPTFASVKAAFTVGNIFLIVSQNMPATQPGSLAHEDYVEIMSFLLKKNGYPAGTTELAYDGATKSNVPLVFHAR
jgi:polar amino acid transport system substrate-binding protein